MRCRSPRKQSPYHTPSIVWKWKAAYTFPFPDTYPASVFEARAGILRDMGPGGIPEDPRIDKYHQTKMWVCAWWASTSILRPVFHGMQWCIR